MPCVIVMWIKSASSFEPHTRTHRSTSKSGRVNMGRKLSFTLSIVGFAGVALFTLPAMTAPIAVTKGVVAILPVDGEEIVQVRAARGYRGAAVRRGGAVYRGGGVVRRGAVVRPGAVVGGAYYGGGYCDPNYQNCGTGGYYSGGVYRGGAVVRGRTVVRGGAAVRGQGAHVAHRGYRGGRRR
jgi:hypothetical protein